MGNTKVAGKDINVKIGAQGGEVLYERLAGVEVCVVDEGDVGFGEDVGANEGFVRLGRG